MTLRHTEPMRTVVCAVAALLLLTGCGGASKADSKTSSTPTVTVTKTAAPAAVPTARAAATQAPSRSEYVAMFRSTASLMLQGNTPADNKAYAEAVCERKRMNYSAADLTTFTRKATSNQLSRGQSRILTEAAVDAYCPG